MSASIPAMADLLNGRTLPLDSIPCYEPRVFVRLLETRIAAGGRVCAFFASSTPTPCDAIMLYLVLADDAANRLAVAALRIEGDRYEALTPRCPQVHLFEREIAEQTGLIPEGHPDLKPVRYGRPRAGRDAWGRPADAWPPPAVCDFTPITGDAIHEVAVGPVHAGVIEPGHFRFQCHGEQVFRLEIALGYQHRGVEAALRGAWGPRTLALTETLAGDTTIGHATTCCQVIEALTATMKTARAQAIRAIALELERVANHVGDLGALASDVGYLPTASYCGRIRGDVLNMTAVLCGNRFGRGLVKPGGVAWDIEPARRDALLARLDQVAKDCRSAIELLWETPSVMARFEATGELPGRIARDLGIVGPAARASGLRRDIRQDQPSGLFRFTQIPVASCESGDVYARAYVRWQEIQSSLTFLREQLRMLPAGAILAPPPPPALQPARLAVALNEGWRGEICHAAITDVNGRFACYKVVDPSFHNWSGLAYALRDGEISDFPLCNKSFNLSYCGHDL